LIVAETPFSFDHLLIGVAGAQEHDAGQGGVPSVGADPLIAEEERAVADHGAVELVLVVALVILIGILAWKARAAIMGALDGRIDRIRRDLDEAERLRADAEAALARIAARRTEAEADAAAIVAHAHEEAERLRRQAAIDIEAAMQRREARAMDRIAQAEVAAVAEIRGVAVDVAVAAARSVVASMLAADPARGTALIDNAIAELPAKLH
jgi:F-type H+-transporting ATPase subunit b